MLHVFLRALQSFLRSDGDFTLRIFCDTRICGPLLISAHICSSFSGSLQMTLKQNHLNALGIADQLHGSRARTRKHDLHADCSLSRRCAKMSSIVSHTSLCDVLSICSTCSLGVCFQNYSVLECSATPRRHCSLVLRDLWLLPSFCSLFHDGPWALGRVI